MSAFKMTEYLGYRGKQGPGWCLGPGTERGWSPGPRATEPVGDGLCVSFVLWLPDPKREWDQANR